MIEFHCRPPSLPDVRGYSHVTVASGPVVHISGQVPVRPDGSTVGGSAAVQTEQVFQNLEAALKTVGATWSQVVKMTYFLRDMGDLDEVRRVRDRYVDPDRPPASSLVQVAGLVHPDLRLKVEAVAVIDPY